MALVLRNGGGHESVRQPQGDFLPGSAGEAGVVREAPPGQGRIAEDEVDHPEEPGQAGNAHGRVISVAAAVIEVLRRLGGQYHAERPRHVLEIRRGKGDAVDAATGQALPEQLFKELPAVGRRGVQHQHAVGVVVDAIEHQLRHDGELPVSGEFAAGAYFHQVVPRGLDGAGAQRVAFRGCQQIAAVGQI